MSDTLPTAGSHLRFTNPPELSRPTGYTHIVEARPGRIIYVAGQIALDASGALVGAGDARAQALQVFENLKAALAAAGATFDDVVKLNWYVTDVGSLAAFREVRDAFVNVERPPASTFVKVAGLVREEFLIEVECVAVAAD
jgi:enamine deaminase RidA (YjgF/YER057c/UK114 family)